MTDIIAAIYTGAKEGLTASEIAKGTIYRPATVRLLAHDMGVALTREGRQHGPSTIQKLRRYAEAGASHKQVVEELGMAPSTLTRLSQKYSIHFTPAPRGHAKE